MQYFKHIKLTPSTTRIFDATEVMMYLVEGEDRAVLIDTGNGLGSLKSYVDSLTKLPYDVICTHGHIDHAGGIGEFEKVYLNHLDWELTKKADFLESRKNYCKMTMGDAYQDVNDADFITGDKTELLELTDGMEFDLGGVTIKAIAAPGHTQGTMCFLWKEEKIILFGDACNPRSFLFLPESTTIAEYKENLMHLKTYEPEYDTVILSHGPEFMPKSLLDDNIECCDAILTGKADDIDFEFMGRKSYWAKKVDNDGRRLDGKHANIVYNKERIR